MTRVRNIGGTHRRLDLGDPRGKTKNYVTGSHNDIRFSGDSGKNRFNIGGHDNNVEVRNIGRNDKVTLEGHRRDWDVVGGNRRDGSVLYRNKVNGNRVMVRTDKGRNDKFVKRRVKFSKYHSSQRSHAVWPGSGHLNYSQAHRVNQAPYPHFGAGAHAACLHPRSFGAYHQGFNDGYRRAAWQSRVPVSWALEKSFATTRHFDINDRHQDFHR